MTHVENTEEKPKRRLLEATIIVLSIIFAFILAEVAYRAYVFFQFAVSAKYAISIVDAKSPKNDINRPGNILGLFPRKTEYNVYMLSPENIVLTQHKIHTNNLGWTSRYDLAPKKEAGEFRVIVAGGSTTAAVSNEYGWTDIVHEQLSKDTKLIEATKNKKISVMGVGIPGANIALIARSASVIARRLDADLLVLNISIEHLTDRSYSTDFDALKFDLAADLAAVPSVVPPPSPAPASDVEINGVGIDLVCSKFTSRSITDPHCRLSTMWYVPPGVKLSPEEIQAVKRSAARKRLLYTVFLSPKPVLLLELMGQSVLSAANAQPAGERLSAETAALFAGPVFIGGQMTSEQAAFQAKQMWGALSFIRSIHPNILIVNNPHTWHWTTPLGPTIEKIFKQIADQGFDVEDMKWRMPMQGGPAAWKSWYTADGHWSDFGSDIYGKAVASVIRERLLKASGVEADSKESNCRPAFEKFQEARLASQANNDNALSALNSAVSMLPERLGDAHRKGRGSYADCGFVSDLFAERAWLLELGGQREQSESDWRNAFEFGHDRSAVLRKRIALRQSRKNDAGVLPDLEELLKIQPDDKDVLLQRAEILGAKGEGFVREAAAAFAELARRHPNEIAHWHRSAQAHMIAKNYEQVILDVGQALKLDPRNAGMYFTRYNAYGGLGRWQDALNDLDKVIEILPKEVVFYRARASVLELLGRKADAKRDLDTALSLEKTK